MLFFYSYLILRFGNDFEISKVIDVIDGDTVIIETGESVRYIGIDTPETVYPGKPVDCYGNEATKRNIELVQGKYVLLEKDIEDLDKFGRLLRYVYTIDSFVNKRLVGEGYAYSYYFPPDLKHFSVLANTEIEAIKNNVGLWKNCK